MSSTASQEIEKRIKPETQKESRPKLRITEETTLSRLTKSIEKFDPSPAPRTPRTMRTKTSAFSAQNIDEI